MTFDVTQFENQDEGKFTFRLQNGEEMMVDGKPVVCRMHGMGSKAQVRAEYKLTRENTANTMAALTNRPAANAEDEAFKRGAQASEGRIREGAAGHAQPSTLRAGCRPWWPLRLPGRTCRRAASA